MLKYVHISMHIQFYTVSLWLFTPPQDEDTVQDHWEDYKLDAQYDSHIYDNYRYSRYVSDFDIETVADHQQLLVALGSLSSSVEQYMPHSANSVKCKTNKKQDLIELLADSGTSLNFTYTWAKQPKWIPRSTWWWLWCTNCYKFSSLDSQGVGMHVPHNFCNFWDKKQKIYLLVPCLLCTRD